jgi:hypothetical protein
VKCRFAGLRPGNVAITLRVMKAAPVRSLARWSIQFRFTSLATFAFLTRSVRATKTHSLSGLRPWSRNHADAICANSTLFPRSI